MIKCLIATVHHTNIRQCHFLPPNMYSKNARKIKDGKIWRKKLELVYLPILCISPNGLQAGHCDPPPHNFYRISRHFRSIRKFFFHKMAAGGHFVWPKITFHHISRHFKWIQNFYFFGFCSQIWWPKITFDRISRHFRSIRNFVLICSQNGCRRPFWMAEKSLLIAFLTISD